jgi:hypothetical protein
MTYTAVILISFLSGASCLIYVLVWSRFLNLIFGVSAYAVATVLFSGGMLWAAVKVRARYWSPTPSQVTGFTVRSWTSSRVVEVYKVYFDAASLSVTRR